MDIIKRLIRTILNKPDEPIATIVIFNSKYEHPDGLYPLKYAN